MIKDGIVAGKSSNFGSRSLGWWSGLCLGEYLHIHANIHTPLNEGRDKGSIEGRLFAHWPNCVCVCVCMSKHDSDNKTEKYSHKNSSVGSYILFYCSVFKRKEKRVYVTGSCDLLRCCVN